MKKMLWLFVLLALCLSCAAGALAAEAADISKSCQITAQGKGKGQIKRMLDRDYQTGMKVDAQKTIVIQHDGEAISGVFLQYFKDPLPTEIQVGSGDTWTTIATTGTHLSDWVALPEGTHSVRLLNPSDKAISIA